MATTWTSSEFSTSNQYIKYKIYITQNSQSVSGNSSNVTVKVKFYRTNSGYTTYGTGTLKVTVDGSVYNESISPSDKITEAGIYLFNRTFTIYHGSNGSKTLTVKSQMDHAMFTSSENSFSQALTNIPRKSTLSVSNGTLGTSQTLTVTRQSNSFTHTITYKCGSASGTVCTKSSSTSINFTPPTSLSSQNTTGTTVSITYTITTYNGDTSVGSNIYSKTCSIPSSVKPSCSISISDPTGYFSTYGKYIKGVSKMQVSVTATKSYGSDIVSYSTSANGSKYTTSSFTTGIVQSSGTLTVSSTVKDRRGRSGTSSKTISAVDYSVPVVSKLNVLRCNSDGTENNQGAYAKVTFSASVSSLSGCTVSNTSKYTLKYKKTNVSSYTSVVFDGTNGTSGLTNIPSVSDISYIFSADTSSSYNICLEVMDSFNTVTVNASVSTGYTLMHWKSNGLGMSIGKVSELDNVFDVGFKTRFSGGILQQVLAKGTNLDDVKTPNIYTGLDCGNNKSEYVNCPITSSTFVLYVSDIGYNNARVYQKLVSFSTTNYARQVWERMYSSNTGWADWMLTSDYNQSILWSGGSRMAANTTINLSMPISKQPNGIVLVFSTYDQENSTPTDGTFNAHFIPKAFVSDKNGKGHCFFMTHNLGKYAATKYIYIYDDKLVGHDENMQIITNSNSGLSFQNNLFCLRYVIGV